MMFIYVSRILRFVLHIICYVCFSVCASEMYSLGANAKVFMERLNAGLHEIKNELNSNSFLAYMDAIGDIYRSENGKILFARLHNLLSKHEKLKVRFCCGVNISFDSANADNGVLCIFVPECINDVVLQSESINNIEYTVKEKPDMKLLFIACMQTDMHVIFFHELLHMEHFLEEFNGEATISGGFVSNGKERNFAYIKYSEAKKMEKMHIQSCEYDYFPEFQYKRDEPLWYSFEERRTVLGPDIDGLTENVYRKEVSLPLRYIYQGDEKFFELAGCVQNVLNGITDSDLTELTIDCSKEIGVWWSPKCIRGIYDENYKLRENVLEPDPHNMKNLE